MLVYRYHSDADLVILLQQDDHAAYTEIYNRYSGLLYTHVYKQLNDREEAKDLIQELFTSLWNKRHQLYIHTKLSSYMYMAVRNRVINVIAHKHIESSYYTALETSLHVENAVTDHMAREKQLAAIIEKEIDGLPPKMRMIFNLSRKSYFSHKEIAEKLELSEATVKKQVNNALKVLRAKLETFLSLLMLFFL